MTAVPKENSIKLTMKVILPIDKQTKLELAKISIATTDGPHIKKAGHTSPISLGEAIVAKLLTATTGGSHIKQAGSTPPMSLGEAIVVKSSIATSIGSHTKQTRSSPPMSLRKPIVVKQASRTPHISLGEAIVPIHIKQTKIELQIPSVTATGTGTVGIKQAGKIPPKSLGQTILPSNVKKLMSPTARTVDTSPQLTMVERNKMQLLKSVVEEPVIEPQTTSVPEKKETRIIFQSSIEDYQNHAFFHLSDNNDEYGTLGTFSADFEMFPVAAELKESLSSHIDETGVLPVSTLIPVQKETKLIFQSSIDDIQNHPFFHLGSNFGKYGTVAAFTDDADIYQIDSQIVSAALKKIKSHNSYIKTPVVDSVSNATHLSDIVGEFSPSIIIQRSMLTCQKDAYKPYSCPVPGCCKNYKNLNGIKYHALKAHGNTPKNPRKKEFKNEKLVRRSTTFVTLPPPPKRMCEEREEEIIDVVN